MILDIDHWYLGYEEIVDNCSAHQNDGVPGTCLILCNCDVDAMAAARILTFMMRSDNISYSILPCSNQSSLQKHLEETPLDDVKAVLLLNFGAARNMTKLFETTNNNNNDSSSSSGLLPTSVKVYVMDCRRPVHLANIYAGDNVVVFWDQTNGSDPLPSDGDDLSGNEDEDDDEESSSEEEDDDSDDSSDDSDSDDDSEAQEEEANFDDVAAVAPPQVAAPAQEESDVDYDGEDERDENDHRRRSRTRRAPPSAGANDNDDDDDEASASSSGQPKRQRTDGPDAAVAVADSTEDGVTDAEPESPDSASAKADTAQEEEVPALSPQELHRRRRDSLRKYYSSGSFFGSPASYVAFRLAAQLRFGEQPDLLWYACVGVTDAYLHSRLDVAGYTTLALDLRRHCLRLFPNDMFERAMNTVYAEDLMGGSGLSSSNNDANAFSGSNSRTKITFDENGRIVSGKDYRFFLLRHSSLFDSMVTSDVVSTKMQVWTKHGRQRLQELLAKMGYPLDECQQPFAFMRPSLKRQLNDKIQLHANEYGLDNFEFTSFFRVTGYQSLLSASDTSYAVTALLECETPASIAAAGAQQEIDEYKEELTSFNIAFDALNANDAPKTNLASLGAKGHDSSSLVNGGNLSGNTGIGAGIRQAKSLQNNIISTAVSLTQREALVRLSHFRYAYLTCTSAGENQTSRNEIIRGSINAEDEQKHHIFAKPLALSRLAHYLMDMNRENGKWTGKRARPLVLLAEKPRTGTYLVVGYEYPERSGTFTRNRFGMNFELTAKSMNGTFKFDSFDSNVVEVDGKDVQRFIEQLHYLMDSVARDDV